MLEIEKTVDLDRDLYKDAVAIREQVFVNEQGIPIEKEMKGEDGPCYMLVTLMVIRWQLRGL